MAKLIGLIGRKGSGKTTIANRVMQAHPEYTLRPLAGPLKELCRGVFHLSDETLYGPSAGRDIYVTNSYSFAWGELASMRFYLKSKEIAHQLFPALNSDKVHAHFEKCLEKLRSERFRNPGEMVSCRRILEVIGTDWGRALDPDVWLKAWEGNYRAAGQPPTIVDDVRFVNEARLIDELRGQNWFVDARGRVPPPAADAHVSDLCRFTEFGAYCNNYLVTEHDAPELPRP